jgi:fructose-1,6-bisphosphatase/inositol monophosphatase family enzyme
VTDSAPSKTDLRFFKDTAEEIINESRSIIKKAMEEGFSHRLKSDQSFVTDVDFEVEEAIRAGIKSFFPEHRITGEELPQHDTDSPYEWIIDPIDGTHSFRHHVPLFGTLLALQFNGSSVLGIIDLPGLNRCYSGAAGLGTYCNGDLLTLKNLTDGETIEKEIIAIGERHQFIKAGKTDIFDTLMKSHPSVRTYCDCFGHAMAVEGAVGAMVDYNLRPWDIAATEVLIAEAGGKYILNQTSDPGGEKPRFNVIFGKPAVVDWIVETIQP